MDRLFTGYWLLFLMFFEGDSAADSNYRLPLEVLPESYEISLIPYLDKEESRSFTFDGTVNVTVKAITDARNITLHAQWLDIKGISSPSLNVTGFQRNEEMDFLIIQLEKPLLNQSVHHIIIKFTGILSRTLEGFYKSWYLSDSEETRYIATTQFEPTYARQAFPCFDEPALKATFVIRIAPPLEYHAVSNMPVENISNPDPQTENRKWYNFQRTPVMSTYLVAFVVSQYANIEEGKFQLFAQPEKIEQGRFALTMAPKILNTLEKLTGINYTLPKLDQVAIPDFEAAAMENWGLITYKDTILLIENANYSEELLQIEAHELSHQWLGNLVSPAWWSFIWLNEAFANFFSYLVAQEVDSQTMWMSDKFFELIFQSMFMEGFVLFKTRPLTTAVETPEEIKELFDYIIYEKGASIIRTIYYFLTPATFLKGLHLYLEKMSYKSATPEDLFAALQEAATEDKVLPTGLTVKAILDTWTLQISYPLLTVRRDYEAGTATITQSPYNLSIHITGEERWYVPITYTTRKERDFNTTAPKTWLSAEKGSEVVLEGLDKDDWLILNIQISAHYRVKYDRRNWELLNSSLTLPQYDGIHPMNAAQILSDIKEMMPVEYSLDIIARLREVEPNVRKIVLKMFSHLYSRMSHFNYFSELKKVFLPLFQNKREDKTSSDLEEIEDWIHALKESPEQLQRKDGEGRPAELCATMRKDPDVWDTLWARYQSASSKSARRDVLAALGCARDAERLLLASVALPPEQERVLEEDRAAAIAAPCGSETRRAVGGGGAEACKQALTFLAENARRLHKLLEDPDEYLWLVRNLGSTLQTEEQYEMLQFAATSMAAQRSTLKMELWADILRNARARVKSIEEEGAPIISWLRKRGALV